MSYRTAAYYLPGPLSILAGAGHFIHITSPFRRIEGGYEFQAYNHGMNRTYQLSESEFGSVFYGLIVSC